MKLFKPAKKSLNATQKHSSIIAQNRRFKPEQPKCELLIETVYDSCDGYGSSAQDISLSLKSLVNTRVIPTYSAPNADELAHPRMVPLVDKLKIFTGDKYLLYHVPAQTEVWKRHEDRERIIFTMFETTSIPNTWRDRINGKFDRLLVPCTFNKQIFESAGIKIPIHVVPLGVDGVKWPYKIRSVDDTRPFRFLLMFANHYLDDKRKNGLLAIEAFKKAFPPNSGAELVIKISGPIPSSLTEQPSNIRLISKRATQSELVMLMHEADCFLFPSNGEGFGLPPREAMATGLPVITTNWSSLSHIAEIPGLCYSIDPIGLQDAYFSQEMANDHNSGNTLFGQYAKITVDQLADQMSYVFNHREEAICVGKYAANWVRQYENWSLTGERILSIFNKSTYEVDMKPIELLSVTKYGKAIKIATEFDIPKLPSSIGKFNLRIQSLTLDDGTEIKDPNVTNGTYVFEIDASMELLNKTFNFVIPKNSIPNGVKTITVGFVQENVRWYEDTFLKISL